MFLSQKDQRKYPHLGVVDTAVYRAMINGGATNFGGWRNRTNGYFCDAGTAPMINLETNPYTVLCFLTLTHTTVPQYISNHERETMGKTIGMDDSDVKLLKFLTSKIHFHC
jgi:hypothetical protein